MNPMDVVRWAFAVVALALAVVALCVMVVVIRGLFATDEESEPKPKRIDLGDKS